MNWLKSRKRHTEVISKLKLMKNEDRSTETEKGAYSLTDVAGAGVGRL